MFEGWQKKPEGVDPEAFVWLEIDDRVGEIEDNEVNREMMKTLAEKMLSLETDEMLSRK